MTILPDFGGIAGEMAGPNNEGAICDGSQGESR